MNTTPQSSIWDSDNLALTMGSIIAVTVIAFQGLAVATIAPVITEDLNGEHLYGWVFNAFLIPHLVGVVMGGREVDRRPPWQVFFPSQILFALGLIVSTVADDMGTLFLGRALVGFACGTLASTVYAIIGAKYDDRLRPAMLAAISTAWVVPSLIGPMLAGFVADRFHWHWVFLGLLPLLIVICILTWKPYFNVRITNDPDAERTNRRRLPLAIVLAAGTFLFLAGPDVQPLMELIGENIGSVPLPVMVLVTVAGLAITIVALQRLLPPGFARLEPMLPAATALRGLAIGGFAITETFVVYTLKNVGGLSSSQAGVILTVGSLTWTLGSIMQARMDRTRGVESRGPRMVVGTLLMFGAAAVITGMVLITQDIWWQVALVAFAVTGFGIGLSFTTSTAVAFAHAARGQDGLVSSNLLLFDLFGQAIGVGIGGFVLAFGLDRVWSQPTSAGLAMSLSLLFLGAAVIAAVRMSRSSLAAPQIDQAL